MATFNLTSKDTAGVGANKVARMSTRHQGEYARIVEGVLDVEWLIRNGNTVAAGDIFQLILIPANTVLLFGGAQVIKPFNGTTPTVNVGLGASNDIIDAAAVTAEGFLAAGAGGQANIVTRTDATYVPGTYNQWVQAEDTLDVTLNAGATAPTEGVLRIYGLMAKLEEVGQAVPSLAPRNQLA